MLGCYVVRLLERSKQNNQQQPNNIPNHDNCFNSFKIPCLTAERCADSPPQRSTRSLCARYQSYDWQIISSFDQRGCQPSSALARVMAKGRYADVMDLSERLLAPETGLVVEQASFRTGADGVDLELELASLGGRP